MPNGNISFSSMCSHNYFRFPCKVNQPWRRLPGCHRGGNISHFYSFTLFDLCWISNHLLFTQLKLDILCETVSLADDYTWLLICAGCHYQRNSYSEWKKYAQGKVFLLFKLSQKAKLNEVLGIVAFPSTFSDFSYLPWLLPSNVEPKICDIFYNKTISTLT